MCFLYLRQSLNGGRSIMDMIFSLGCLPGAGLEPRHWCAAMVFRRGPVAVPEAGSFDTTLLYSSGITFYLLLQYLSALFVNF